MNPRELTLTLLDEYELAGKYVNLSLSSHRLDGISREERGLVTALLYTTVEHKLTYDYYISATAKRSTDKIDIHTLNTLRLGAAQLIDMDRIPDYVAVNETVKLGRNKGGRGFINGILRSLIRLRDSDSLPTPDRTKSVARYLSVAYSFPTELVRHFISLYGESETERLLASFNNDSYTDLTVNIGRISRDGLAARLSEQGIVAAPSPLSPMSLRVEGSLDPRTLSGFDEGLFFVQDVSCAVSAHALGTTEGDRVIDVCACPGGKSFAAAILAGGTGSVTSLDLHGSKLPLIENGALRLGLSNITVMENDATHPCVEFFGGFDRVICDVPCSGLGVLGKKADLRYNAAATMEGLPSLQYEILSASANYLKTGGTLVYSTCTLNPHENEENVLRFISEHSEFCLTDFTVGTLSSVGGMLTLAPHTHRTDGFFIARLTKLK